MVKFLLKLFLLEALIFLQFFGNSSSVPCSNNSWIQLPETTVSQLQSDVDASNVTDCQMQCLGNSSCVGVAWNWNSSECYFNLDPSNIGISYMNQSDAIYYGLVRNYSTCDKDKYTCSWIGDKDYHGFQGWEVDRRDLIGCVQACQDNASCTAVDWNYQESSCWMFSGIPYTGAQTGIFRFIRNCTGGPPSPVTPRYTPRISTVGPVTTASSSVSTSTSLTSSSPAGPSSVTSSSSASTSSVTSSTTASSSSSSAMSSLGSPTSTTSTTTTAAAPPSTSTTASSTSTSTITSSTITISTPSTSAQNSSAQALELSSEEGSDWYPLAIKPAYIVLAGVGGGCLLMVITAVVILCEYPLNNGSSTTKHVHAYEAHSPDTHYASASSEENVDMNEIEMELDKRPHGEAEE